MYVLGAVALLLGYGCLMTSLNIVTKWTHGHPPTNPEFLAVFIGVPFFFGGGLLLIVSAARGPPRLTVARGGIKLEKRSRHQMGAMEQPVALSAQNHQGRPSGPQDIFGGCRRNRRQHQPKPEGSKNLIDIG